jgi:hypothetical protein
VIEQELVSDPVQLVGGHPGLDVLTDFGQSLRRDPAGYAHPLDCLGVLDVALAHARGAAADVLGPGDMGGDVAVRGDPAGLEGCRHDLGF